MPDTFECTNECTKDVTYTEAGEFKYSSAKTESTPKIEKTWQYSEKVQSVPTSRTVGEIKLRIASREMPETKNVNSTK